MSSDDFMSLHDVYDGLCQDEKCQKTAYMLQFLWRGVRHAYYDRQVYGEPFQKNEFVWLHSPVVLRGQSKKLPSSMDGSLSSIIEKLSDSDYKLKHIKGGRLPVVVHFDRLKLCRRATCSTEVDQNDSNQRKSIAETQQDPVSHDIFGKDLELVDEDPHKHLYPR